MSNLYRHIGKQHLLINESNKIVDKTSDKITHNKRGDLQQHKNCPKSKQQLKLDSFVERITL